MVRKAGEKPLEYLTHHDEGGVSSPASRPAAAAVKIRLTENITLELREVQAPSTRNKPDTGGAGKASPDFSFDIAGNAACLVGLRCRYRG